MTPVSYLYGLETVEETVNHQELGLFIKELMENEIVPTLDGPPEELAAFSNEVLNRFMNPYIKHYLLSISLNSISKFSTRNLPTLLDYVKQSGTLPKRLVFSLSCLLHFYRGKRGDEDIPLQDNPEILQIFQTLWEKVDQHELHMEGLVKKVLADKQLWSMDLTSIPNLVKAVTTNLLTIKQIGVKEALKELCGTSIK
jgi:tagaturonate reductase